MLLGLPYFDALLLLGAGLLAAAANALASGGTFLTFWDIYLRPTKD